MIENLIRRAMGYTGDIFTEFRSDPAHWDNNKRRLHGLPLLRKRSNYKGRKNIVPAVFFACAEEAIFSLIPAVTDEIFSSLADVRDIQIGKRNIYEP